MSDHAGISLLHKHLNALVAVEFFTIPVYLTGVYSFKKTELAKKDVWNIQQKTLSVAIQEMYHLQMAGNLANAVGHKPVVPGLSLKPKNNTIPYLKKENGPATKFDLGNLNTLIETMVKIETPTASYVAMPNAEAEYDSIAKLYFATMLLIDLALFEKWFEGKGIETKLQVAYGAFNKRYKFNKIENLADLGSAINAITDQGDGSDVAIEFCKHHEDRPLSKLLVTSDNADDVHPRFQPTHTSRFYQYDAKTHLARFQTVQNDIAGKDYFYSDEPSPSDIIPTWHGLSSSEIQKYHNVIWSYMIFILNKGFDKGELAGGFIPDGYDISFTETMTAFKYTIPILWQLGSVPYFEYTANVSSSDVNEAFAKIDPLCLFHWDDKTQVLRKSNAWKPNACMGLNRCNGQGWGKTGTKPGDCQCATADFHTCVGSNSCNYQGGCGFIASEQGAGTGLAPADKQFIPGEEYTSGVSGAGLGGCQTPIAPAQKFSSTNKSAIEGDKTWTAQQKAGLEALLGKSVWDRARKVLQEQQPDMGTPPASKGVYNGTERRNAIEPTSTN